MTKDNTKGNQRSTVRYTILEECILKAKWKLKYEERKDKAITDKASYRKLPSLSVALTNI